MGSPTSPFGTSFDAIVRRSSVQGRSLSSLSTITRVQGSLPLPSSVSSYRSGPTGVRSSNSAALDRRALSNASVAGTTNRNPTQVLQNPTFDSVRSRFPMPSFPQTARDTFGNNLRVPTTGLRDTSVDPRPNVIVRSPTSFQEEPAGSTGATLARDLLATAARREAST